MVADFGIALAVSAAAGGRITETGLSLGTPHYMSPEQAMGEREITARSDVYALGCVLYEMLTGEPPFTGPTAQVILAKVMTAAPEPVTTYRRTVPPHVVAVVTVALQKLPADRFATTADLHAALDDPHFSAPDAVAAPPRRVRTPALVAGALVLGLLVGVLVQPGADRRTAPRAAQVQITLPPGVTLPLDHDYPVLAVSPDGSRLVFVGERDGRRRLYVRTFAAAQSRLIEGTEGALVPFFSPDGEWVAYLAGNMLYRVAVSGGTPVPMFRTVGEGVHQGAAWVADSVLVIAGSPNDGLVRGEIGGDSIGASFGLQPLPGQTVPAAWPMRVQTGGDVVFAARDEQAGGTDVALHASGSGRPRTLVNGATFPQFAGGHLLFARGVSLYAIAYDATRGETRDLEREILTGVMAGGRGVSHYVVGGDVLVYVSGDTISSARELVWVDRAGTVVSAGAEPRVYDRPRIAPDGRRVALTINEGPGDVWMLDLDRNTLQPLTRHPGEDFGAIWSPDGRSLTFASEIGEDHGEGGPALALMRQVGGTTEQLTFTPAAGSWEFPTSWSPDGRSIVVTRRQAGRADIALFRLDSADMVPLVESAAQDFSGRVSANGRWLAYVSSESGRDEIWIRPFGLPGGATQVSMDGGVEPVWSRDARELFYRIGDDMMVVNVAPGTELQPGRPRHLFNGRFDHSLIGGGEANYDVSPDGHRFLMVRRMRSVQPTILQVVFDWPSVLLPPGDRRP
jgi:serine/threonine-protein kinase